MSHKALQWALRVTAGAKLPPAASLLLIVLADHHNPEKGCFPSQATLSKRTGMSARWVRKHLTLLRDRGLIRTVCRGRRNGYTLLMGAGNSGTPVPQSEAELDIKTVQSVPVNSGAGVPLLYIHTGTGVPLVLTSKEESSLTSKGTVEFAAQIDPTNPEPEPGVPEKKSEPGDSQSFVKGETMDCLSVVKRVMEPKTEEEAFARVAEARAKPSGITGSVLARFWRDLHGLYLPMLALPEMTIVQKRQLAQAYKLAGEDFLPALACALRGWSSFTAYVSGHGGFVKPSEKYGMVIPSPVVVLMYVQLMVVYYREQVQPSAPTPVKKVKQVKPAPAVPLPTGDAPATLDDIEAIFSGSKSGT